MQNSMKISVRELSAIGLFAAIITVCAQISIPMPVGVPMTMQTFAIPLAGLILGKRNGFLAAFVYVLLGLVGVPVFAEFSGGAGVVFGKTGGFILSFPLMALAAGIGSDKTNKLWQVTWLVIGAVVNYLCGMLMFAAVMSMDLPLSFTYTVLPFIPTAIIKIVLVVVLGNVIKKALIRSRVFVPQKRNL